MQRLRITKSNRFRGGCVPQARGAARLGTAAFTLVEVMITVGILSVMGGGILTLWPAMAKVNSLEQERARAFQIACDQMESSVRQLNFPNIASSQSVLIWDNGTTGTTADDTRGTLDIIVRDAKTGTQITATPTSLTPSLWYRVEVTVSWHPRGDLKNKTMRETVMTYVVP